MKICKVTLIKRFNENICENIYPIGYNAHKISIIAYDELPLDDGDNPGYCIGIVSDDFSFTDDMAEISKSDANVFINERAAVYKNSDLQNKFKILRGNLLVNAGIS